MSNLERLRGALALTAIINLGGAAVAACGSGSRNKSSLPGVQVEVAAARANGIHAMLANGDGGFLVNGIRLAVNCGSNDPFGLHGKIETGPLAGDVALFLPRHDLKSPDHADRGGPSLTLPAC